MSLSLTKSTAAAAELVEFEPKDDSDCDTEAITKEEEWITKRKTELTTTRQIETRVKRQVVLEDGKLVEDSGPIVSTNTTEDTDKQETETTEKRDLGIPVTEVDGATAALPPPAQPANSQRQLVALDDNNGGGGKVSTKMVARPADGLVREINEKRIVSHEEVKDYLETEAVRHLGDFPDETYVQAVNSGAQNLQELLQQSADTQRQQLASTGAPRVIASTSKSRKTIDSEDTLRRSLAQDDGTIVTEHRKTTEHDLIVDEDLPEKDDHSTGSREKIDTVEATQRYLKQRDEQHVDLVADGKIVGTEMRYAAETMQLEKDGSLERPGDWDSLSDRMRKQRRSHQKTILQQHKAALLADRKDALTKRPLDFDREEETRKGETMKWLESHFGSESTASNDSRDDDAEVEPTKKTYFNVTIKSSEAQMAALNGHHKAANHHHPDTMAYDVAAAAGTGTGTGKSKYYQGISNWSERKETPTNHFASQAFRDDLQETVERNRLKKGGGATRGSRDQLNVDHYLHAASDTYVSREDIIHQKRQSLSSQFLAKNRRGSREHLLEEFEAPVAKERDAARYDLNKTTADHKHPRSGCAMDGAAFHAATARIIDTHDTYRNNDAKHGFNTLKYPVRSSSPELEDLPQTSTLGRPTVPQRRRAIEKKLRQQQSLTPPLKVPSENNRDLVEPPPDYSPPPRSRSSSPQIDYATSGRSKIDMSGYAATPAPMTQHGTTMSGVNVNLTRKQHQRTRFAPTTPSSVAYPPPPTATVTGTATSRPLMSSQTTQTLTTPSTLSTSTAASHKSNKVGQVIGNSIRKLVSKIRSASAERKLRMKSKSKSREQSPSPLAMQDRQENVTYQQYNVIDGHIGSGAGGAHPGTNEADLGRRGNQVLYKRAVSADPFANDNGRDQVDQVASPRQRYYLGEDPYSSSLYGKENMYDPESLMKRHRNNGDHIEPIYANRSSAMNQRESSAQKGRDEGDLYNQRNISSSTLGRYQKSGQGKLAGSTPNLNQTYRTVQTLPRKLNEHQHQNHHHQPQQYQRTSTLHQRSNIVSGHSTLGHPEKRAQYQQQQQQKPPAPSAAGPAKPARTYAKALNRSKSFNVHGMNGSNDPSPIYIEKLTKNNYSNNLHASQVYKSNPYLYAGGSKERDSLQSGLKSPSIVNLISRSQRDLTKLGTNEEDERDQLSGQPGQTSYQPVHGQMLGSRLTSNQGGDEKKQLFLKGLHQQAPDLFRTLHGDEIYSGERVTSKYQLQPKHSLDSRPPVVINKDTASIYRRDSLSNDDGPSNAPTYNYSSGMRASELAANKRILMYRDEQRKRGSGATIIEVRNIDGRK